MKPEKLEKVIRDLIEFGRTGGVDRGVARASRLERACQLMYFFGTRIDKEGAVCDYKSMKTNQQRSTEMDNWDWVSEEYEPDSEFEIEVEGEEEDEDQS